MRSVKTATGAARNVADVPIQKERSSHDRFSLSAGNDPPEAETERRRSVIHNTSQQATPLDFQSFSGNPPAACQGEIPETLLQETEVRMKMIQFICGMIVGGMIGVAMMCLMQINRLYRHDREVDE